MTYRVQHGTDQRAWDHFLCTNAGAHHSVLQSWAWGEMQRAYGRVVERAVISDSKGVCAVVLVAVMPLLGGRSFVFSPRGPVLRLDVTDPEPVYAALRESEWWRELCRQHRVVFWRCEPLRLPMPSGGHRVPDVEPAHTLVVDLSRSAEQLRSALKQKTRYNCSVAEKHGVRVSFASGADVDWDRLHTQWTQLLDETSGRHGIRHHPSAYYRTMMHELGQQGLCTLGEAQRGDAVLSMSLLLGYGDTMTYLHGASTQHHKEVMASTLLQWQSILYAQQQGYRWYDFFGAVPANDEHHRLAGVSRFKRGFGGEELTLPGTVEYPVSTGWYTVYRCVKRLLGRSL